MNKRLLFSTIIYRLGVFWMFIKEYKQVLIWHWLEKPIFSKYKPTFNTDSIELDEPLTATDMRMRENDVTLGIPKTSYGLETKIMQIMHRLIRGRNTGQVLINHTLCGSPVTWSLY